MCEDAGARPHPNSAYDEGTRVSVFVHYLCKYLDFMDTAFIVLRKKEEQLSFLHVFHHGSIGVVWGYLLHIGHGNGTAAWGVRRPAPAPAPLCHIRLLHSAPLSHSLWRAARPSHPRRT